MVPLPRLHQRNQGIELRGQAGEMPVRPPLLLRLSGKLARPGAVSPHQEVDQKVQRRLGDLQLDIGKHQGVSKVQGCHREGRGLQPHDLQKRLLQVSAFITLCSLPWIVTPGLLPLFGKAYCFCTNYLRIFF